MTNVYSKQTLHDEMTLNLLNTVLGSYENYFFLEKNNSVKQKKIICTITINLNLKIYTKVLV